MIIKIKDLSVHTIIGVYDWEKTREQELLINVEIDYDSSKAAKKDNIKYALDYYNLCKMIVSEVEENEFNLLETMAAHLLKKIAKNKLVHSAVIEIDKPGCIPNAYGASVVADYARD